MYKLKAVIRRNRTVIKSCLIFAVSILVFAFVYSRLIETPIFRDYLVALTRISGTILNLLGYRVIVLSNSISSPDFSVDVGTGCDGLVPVMIFIAAALAYPCGTRARVIGIAGGALFLSLLNIIRIISLFMIGAFSYRIFETAHLLIWQSAMILAAIVLWLYWARRIVHVVTTS